MNDFDRTLAELERNIGSTLKDLSVNTVPADEVEGYLAEGGRMLQIVRSRLLEADQDYRRQRVELVTRLNDDLQRLDAEHDKSIARLRGVIARLEGLR